MVRHLLDRPRHRTADFVPHALRIEKKARPSKASLALQRRAKSSGASLRLRHYLRIDRGVKA